MKIRLNKNISKIFAVFCVMFVSHSLFLSIQKVSALDLLIRPKVFGFIPTGAGSVSAEGILRYDIGGGADIGIDADLSSIWANPFSIGYTVGLEGGMVTKPIMGDVPQNFIIYSIGGTIGLYYFPISRLFLRADGTAGVQRGALDGFLSPTGFYWRGGGDIGFRFTPSFLLAASGGWRQYEDSREDKHPKSTGVYAGVTAQITLETGNRDRTRVIGTLDQSNAIYPVFLQLYQTSPAATVKIRNRENAEIRNVRLSFRAGNYTSSEFFCGSVGVIPRGGEVELPLLADFSPAVLRFTDNGRILGEIIIRYSFLGQEREVISAATLASHSRNTITEDDTSALAALISPTSPEMLEFSKYIVGIARSNRRIGHNQNMQYAIWLFEGLRATGIRIDETHHRDNEAQFPAETLSFGRGTSRDIALLYAAALESVGISSAFIKVGTDYLIAINLAASSSAAETMFSNTDRILIINDRCWLPIAMSSFEDGFIASWTRGFTTLNQAFSIDDPVEFIVTSNAWANYPPAPLPELGTRVGFANAAVILAESNKVMEQYVVQEILPILWRVEAQIARAPTAALYNRLGILQARAGRINVAKTNYERAANMGLVAAMTNRGSLALSERDYNTAETWFRRALAADAGNQAALRGLERVEGRR